MFDVAIDVCGQCLGEYCGDCVVYPFGLTELPLCMGCAVAASGVRAGSAPRKTGRTQRREALRRRADLGRLRVEPPAAWPPPATQRGFG